MPVLFVLEMVPCILLGACSTALALATWTWTASRGCQICLWTRHLGRELQPYLWVYHSQGLIMVIVGGKLVGGLLNIVYFPSIHKWLVG